MKKLLYIVSAFVLAAMLSGCNKVYPVDSWYQESYVIEFVNNSTSSITFFVPAQGIEGLPAELDDLHNASFYEVGAHEQFTLEDYYVSSISSLGTYDTGDAVPFYVFDTEVLEGNEWSKVVEEKMWLAVYSYTATRIIELGKRVTYPEVAEQEPITQ